MKNIFKRMLCATAAAVAACSFMAAPVSAAWVQNQTGWWYQNTDGSYPSNGWASIGGKWYLFDGAGYMLTGWQQVGGVWYYLNPAGDMATGWKQIGGTWYYLDASGAMKTGWQEIGGAKYYFLSWGGMVTGNQTIDGKSYTFSSSGALTETDTRPETSAIVYWGESGTKYHIDPECRSFKGTAANSGTLDEAKAAGRTDWCGICSKSWTDQKLLEQGNPYAK